MPCVWALTQEEVNQIIMELKNRKSKDIYGMTAEIIKSAKDELCQPLTKLINDCIEEGYFPEQLKIRKVVPIHKNGGVNDCKNYRPISVLPVLSKIFEKVIALRLAEYLERNRYLTKSQHGFRRNRSTTTAMVEVINTRLGTKETK